MKRRESDGMIGYGLTYGDCSVQELSVRTRRAEKFDQNAALACVRVINKAEATKRFRR